MTPREVIVFRYPDNIFVNTVKNGIVIETKWFRNFKLAKQNAAAYCRVYNLPGYLVKTLVMDTVVEAIMVD